MRITTTTIDSALGRWTHSEARSARLAHVVDRMWHFTGRTSLPRERLFPGGYLEVILHLGPTFHDVDARGVTAGAFPIACLTGLQTRPAVIEAPDGVCSVLGIRLRPVGAYTLFGAAVCEVLDQTVDLRALGGGDVAHLAERCNDAPSAEARFECAAQWICARLARAASPPSSLAWAARRIECSDGRESIADLGDQVGLSRARFVDSFRRHTGITPKRYARMLRFRRALSLLQTGRTVSQVALASGYFDQSHLNADFREFGAMTPGEFIRGRHYPGSESLQED
jgi:AraC-like DNA-binding protein